MYGLGAGLQNVLQSDSLHASLEVTRLSLPLKLGQMWTELDKNSKLDLSSCSKANNSSISRIPSCWSNKCSANLTQSFPFLLLKIFKAHALHITTSLFLRKDDVKTQSNLKSFKHFLGLPHLSIFLVHKRQKSWGDELIRSIKKRERKDGVRKEQTYSEHEASLLACAGAHSCLTLGNSMDCRPQGSSVHGILQQEYWSGLSFPSPGGSSWPRGWTQVSCTAGRFFTIWAT